jgi:hypothetical protein
VTALKLVLPSILVLLACIPSPVVVAKPEGDISTVTLATGRKLSAELLAVDSTSVCFLCRDTVWRVAQADLQGVRVEGYNLWWQKGVALGLLAAIDVPIALAFSGTTWLVLTVPATLAIAATEMLLTEPRMDFRPPFDPTSLSRLALYCRYMRYPTQEQWTELLGHYGQQDFFGADQAGRQ